MTAEPDRPSAKGSEPGIAISGENVGTLDQEAQIPKDIFRAFSRSEFRTTPSWHRLLSILQDKGKDKGNGGCYGLYGPRGAGKSWLMMMAISEADTKGGLGLWFPCPAQYDASSFLGSLSDNLANAVERKFVRKDKFSWVLQQSKGFLTPLAAILIGLAVLIYIVNGMVAGGGKLRYYAGLAERDLWIATAIVGVLLASVYIIQLVRESQKAGRLVREATALRERIRFTASLKLAAEMNISGGNALTTAIKRSREKALNERPTTVASLVFDFRNLAEAIAKTVDGPVVIGIDELDKVETPEAVRSLLRDVKGIFEVTGVHFLVSVSEEAAAALHLGTVQTGGRNVFNSSFYTVISLPPLDPDDSKALLYARGFDIDTELTWALSLLAGGNQRELIRTVDLILEQSTNNEPPAYEQAIITVLLEEASAFLYEIIRNCAESVSPKPKEESVLPKLSDKEKLGAWRALDIHSFSATEKFITLGKGAIHRYWDPEWADTSWKTAIQESWRRLLIRLFVAASLIEDHSSEVKMMSSDIPAIMDLRELILVAGRDAGIARFMLETRFGPNLTDRYNAVGFTYDHQLGNLSPDWA